MYFEKDSVFFAMALLVSGILFVWIIGPCHVPSSLSTAADLPTSSTPSAPSSQPPTTFAAPKMVCVFRSTQAISFGGTAVSRRRNSGELHHARRRRRVASRRD